MQACFPKELLSILPFELSLEQIISRDELLRKFDSCGFSRVSLVESVGEIAVRRCIRLLGEAREQRAERRLAFPHHDDVDRAVSAIRTACSATE